MHSNNYNGKLQSDQTQEAPPSDFSKKLRNVRNDSESQESDEIVNYEVIKDEE